MREIRVWVFAFLLVLASLGLVIPSSGFARSQKALEREDSCEYPLWKTLEAAADEAIDPDKRVPAPKPGTSRPGNFFQLYDGKQTDIFRGRAPTREDQLHYLRDIGVSKILIFKDFKSEDEREAMEARYRKAGFQQGSLYWIPFPWQHVNNYEALCRETVEGLRLLKSVVDAKSEGSLYLHCSAGEDRTGFLSGLFRMLQNGWSLDHAYRDELCARGYADGNPHKPRIVAREVHQTLSPLFEGLGNLIQKGALTWENLDNSVCKKLSVEAGATQLPSCREN